VQVKRQSIAFSLRKAPPAQQSTILAKLATTMEGRRKVLAEGTRAPPPRILVALQRGPSCAHVRRR
jgi:hypothetical protein